MKENFYVFLDIDGTMWDLESAVNSFFLTNSYTYFRQPSIKSIDALNFLVAELQKKYIVKLVITSSLRKISSNYATLMKEFGLTYKGTIEMTSLNWPKAEAMYHYIQDKPNKENVVILDDKPMRLLKYFNKNRVIKTNIINGGLDTEKVKDFLEKLKELNENNDLIMTGNSDFAY